MIDLAKTALAGFTLQQRAIGAIIAILIWLAPAGVTWLYMRGQLSAQYELGQAECERADALAAAKALREFHVEQANVTAQAKKDAEQLSKLMRTLATRATRISNELATHAQEHPLPDGCRADPERVRLYNHARQAAAD